MRTKAFTLVELLVVVVILLALIAIALPVANIVRSRSLVSGCANNLSQIGKAVLMYAGDHSGWLPCHSIQSIKAVDERGRMETKVIGRPREWRDALAVYAKSREVFWCPADGYRGKPFVVFLDYPEDKSYLYTSYRMAVLAHMRSSWGPSQALAIRLDRTKRGPAETPYIGDAQWWPRPGSTSWKTFHGGGANALYLDGSVRYTRAD
ncbi:MAG: hypothetical protein AMXMBFR61_04780 [Fimbriimonadales bacterium]